VNSDTTSLADEPLANAEYVGETVKRSKSKGKGVARALIASKREGAVPKKDCNEEDVIMGYADDKEARKRKGAFSKSKQVKIIYSEILKLYLTVSTARLLLRRSRSPAFLLVSSKGLFPLP
jgi:hypothetical protein